MALNEPVIVTLDFGIIKVLVLPLPESVTPVAEIVSSSYPLEGEIVTVTLPPYLT
jgi:hypothetical protein